MSPWTWMLCAFGVLSTYLKCGIEGYDKFNSATKLLHLAVDNTTGRVYLGAVNFLYQLKPELEQEEELKTGPKDDDPTCVPPINNKCKTAVKTDNYNKLLLIDKTNNSLVICGSIYRGICSLWHLNNISKVIYENVNGGEATFVASNDSTVGLIAFTNEADNKSKVIFIGKTQATYSSAIISTRTLSPTNLLVFFELVQDTSTVKPDSHLQYRHDFRFSFKHEKFVYFIFSRTNGLQHEPKTYISRICLSDTSYYSYIEMVLECGEFILVQSAYITSPGKDLAEHMNETGDYGTLTEQDKILFAVFNRGNQKTASQKSSAFCMFSLRQINEKLEEFRELCYSHQGKQDEKDIIYNPYKADQTNNCPAEMTKNQAVEYPCSGEHLPYPIASRKGISAKPQIECETNLSAIAVTVENSKTIVFLGSIDGKIHKVFLDKTAEEYQSMYMNSSSPVNSDLVFDAKRDYLYVMTDKQVTRLPVQECMNYKTCDSCIASKDPYCGWCAAEGTCSRRSDCPKAGEKDHWLWSLHKRCVTVISAVPENMSRNQQNLVQLYIDPFPALTNGDRIECIFGDVKKAIRNFTEGSVTCQSPPLDHINATPPGQDYANVEVYLLYVSGGKSVAFTRTYYSFYDCSAAMKLFPNIPCASCVGSNWTCHWDMAENMCKDGSGKEGQPNIVKSKMAEKCPQFGDPTPSLIPVDVERSITFKGKNLDFYQGKKMTLVITNNFSDKTFRVNKSTLGNFSSAIKLHYDKNDTLTLHFSVQVDGKAVDSRLEVTLHNCEYSNTDCNLCLSAERKYNCVWCNNTDTKKCVYKKLCKVPIENANFCPAPTILHLDPATGPLQGGILLTIKGSNLGKTADDIKEIKVGNTVCIQDKEKYSTSVRVVCKLGEIKVPQSTSVQIVTGNNKTGISVNKFSYTDPEPSGISPTRGICAGGAYLTITGKQLNTGKQEDVKVFLGKVPCTLIMFNESLICITGPCGSTTQTTNVNVSVHYGEKAKKEVHHQKFSYVPNPKIDDLRPKKSIFSGGRNITVTGKGFDAVQKRIMRVEIRKGDGSIAYTNETEALKNSNDTMLIFPSPSVEQEEAPTFIILDNFNVSREFEYVKDPFFERFPKGVLVLKQPPIFVKGTGLNYAMTAEEVKAYIGTEECKVTTLSVKDFVCIPPEKQPPPRRVKRDTNDDLPEFVVKMGYRQYELGKVKYDTPAELPLGLILPLVLIPMLLIIGVSVYCYRRKSQQAEREYKKIQLQLESLEESVRDRCKKEFTDLVTEMEDHSNDVNDVGIPFLDYKTYTDRVFFLPSKDGENDVMITGKLDIPEARRQTVEVALNQFSNLLNSKSFLIHFVHTLESQKDFSAREKVYFASLLTIALHGKLEYYTDIMRTLLLELMEQYVAKNPKLMLRRSETVVERMLSNWMSICLYQFLKDSAGEPLYRLFKGLKHQVEKGPVDAELKKAKYTLNDTGLLGEDVEYHVLTLNVTVQGDPGESMPVKVLSCDSITQVKEKILDQVYRNIPFSQRPARESVVLEWRPGSTGQILSDLDVTSEREGKWRRINTLKHYNVRDFSTVILVRSSHAQQPDDHQQIIHGEKSGLLEEDRRWHLVRQVDEVDESKSKRGSMKEKERTKAITEIYLTRLLSVKGTLQSFVDNFFQSVLSTNQIVPTAVKYYFDFLDEQAQKNEITDEETIHIWKTNSLPLRFWVNILKNPHFIFDVKVNEVVDASLSVIAQTFMDACTKTEYKLSRDSPSNKLLYAREISTYKKMVEDYYKGIRQMVQVSDQDMNTHLAEVSRAHTDKLNTVVALHQLYQYTNKYYDQIINALEQDPAAQKMQLAVRLQQIAAALENKTTDL